MASNQLKLTGRERVREGCRRVASLATHCRGDPGLGVRLVVPNRGWSAGRSVLAPDAGVPATTVVRPSCNAVLFLDRPTASMPRSGAPFQPVVVAVERAREAFGRCPAVQRSGCRQASSRARFRWRRTPPPSRRPSPTRSPPPSSPICRCVGPAPAPARTRRWPATPRRRGSRAPPARRQVATGLQIQRTRSVRVVRKLANQHHQLDQRRGQFANGPGQHRREALQRPMAQEQGSEQPAVGVAPMGDQALAAAAAAAWRNSSVRSAGSRSAACRIRMQERPMLALGKRSAYRSGRYCPSTTALTYGEM
jgi:hypothetical protein